MNRFLKAAIENMEKVEHDYTKPPERPALRQQWTQEAIAYALIAIAEKLDNVVSPAGEAADQPSLRIASHPF